MKRVYFESPKGDITSIRIYGSNTITGVFSVVDIIPFNPNLSYVDVSADFYYYRLEFYNGTALVISTTASLAEDSANIVVKVRIDLGDISETDPAFGDDELVDKIKAATVRVTGSESLGSLTAFQLAQVQNLVMIDCCYNLAYDNARFTKISLPDGISLDKGERVKHYLNIAKQLENAYRMANQDMDASGNEDSIIQTMTKQSYFSSEVRRRF